MILSVTEIHFRLSPDTVHPIPIGKTSIGIADLNLRSATRFSGLFCDDHALVVLIALRGCRIRSE